MEQLSSKEMATIYRILNRLYEGMLGYPEEVWEQEHYDDDELVNRKEIDLLINKLKDNIPQEELKRIDKEMMMEKYGGFSHGPDERVYTVLESAYKKKRIAGVEYFSPSREEVTQRNITIYYLSRRYIIAYCHKRKEIRKFRADRFISAKLNDEKYSIPKDFDKNDYI